MMPEITSQSVRNEANRGIMEGTKYRNGPATLATSEAVTQEGLAPMCSHSTSFPTPDNLISLHKRRPFDRSIKSIVWRFTSGRCWYCGFIADPFDDFCIDHVEPLSRGGTNDIENLVPCCSWCNSRKGSKRIEEWRAGFDDPDEDQCPFTNDLGLFAFELPDWQWFVVSKRNEIRGYRLHKGKC